MFCMPKLLDHYHASSRGRCTVPISARDFDDVRMLNYFLSLCDVGRALRAVIYIVSTGHQP